MNKYIVSVNLWSFSFGVNWWSFWLVHLQARQHFDWLAYILSRNLACPLGISSTAL